MSASGNENPIFGRYSREECGLPPEAAGEPRRRTLVVRAVILLAALAVAGWLAGTATARWREAWLSALPHMVSQAEPAEASELLSKGRIYALALADRPAAARDLAMAGLVAAESAPRRFGYYANVANIFDRVDASQTGSPLAEFAAELMASGVYGELGEYAKAFACLNRADAALKKTPDEKERRSYRLLLVNAQAYYLATAPRGEGRNPEKALHLAQLLISSKDEIPGGGHASGSAAFLDTLASAWHATGDDARAEKTQAFALGLADSAGLDVYLRHYDEYNRR